jgi:subtilisin family serine protease
MKRYIYMLCFLLGITSFSYSQDEKYYYAYDKKIGLNEVKNKVLIGSGAKYFSVTKNTLSTDSKVKRTEWQNDSICIVTIESPQDKAFKEYFLHQEGIKFVQPLYVTDEGLEMGVTDEIVVLFKKDASLKEMSELNKKFHATVKKTTDIYQLLSVPVNVDALEVANAYQLSGLVEFSHPNFIAKVELHQTIPYDPYFINQFYLHNTGQTFNGHSGTTGADINAPEAWDLTKGSSDIIIAVIDQGVTSNHPDLPNTRQIRLNGSNFGDGNPNDPSPTGDYNHGNACTGIIAASHNGQGIAGIAPNCKIMPIRVPFGFGVPVNIYADAITLAKDNGAHIISNSWGNASDDPYFEPVIKNAIDSALTKGRNGKGCVVVFSTGNSANHVNGVDGIIGFPANVPGVLAVGASDRYDQQANYSPTSNLSISYKHQIVDIVAPSHRAYSFQITGETYEVWSIDIPESAGYNIVHTTDDGPLPPLGSSLPASGTNYLSYTGYFGGTSAACPQVAGVAALILSLDSTLYQYEVYDIICSTARKAGGYSYQITSNIPNGTWNAQMGHGVLNAYAALQAACKPVYFIHIPVTANTTVTSCSYIYLEDIYITNNAKLTLNPVTDVFIKNFFDEEEFAVESGASFEVR